MADRPEELRGTLRRTAQWRTAGDRIQTLLDSCAASGAAAYERAQQLVREVVGLYGAGLERIMHSSVTRDLAERLATDDLVASLLLVHGLHPHDVHRRVSDALDRVRPYLGSHGGDVDLLDVTDGPDGQTVRLAFTGSCKSCPSSAVTLELAVEDAVRAAAPEISSIEVVTAEPTSSRRDSGRIADGARAFEWPQPFERSRPDAWHPVPELAELQPGEVAGFQIAGTTAAGVPGRRPGVRLSRPLPGLRRHAGRCGTARVRCCAARAADRISTSCMRVPAAMLQTELTSSPLPLLPRDGVLSVALPAEPMGAPA